MNALTEHARSELRRAGFFDEDSDYGGDLGKTILNMVESFADDGHSGASASVAVSVFERLARFEPLTPLTGADDEWVIHDYNDDCYAQNIRCGHVFKRRDGTAYDIDGRIFREPNGVCFTGRDSRVEVTFPYTPKREYVDVPASEEA